MKTIRRILTATLLLAFTGSALADATIKAAPKGVHLETIEDLKRYAAQIGVQSVQSKAMPLANRTGMLEEERAKLGTWISTQ